MFWGESHGVHGEDSGGSVVSNRVYRFTVANWPTGDQVSFILTQPKSPPSPRGKIMTSPIEIAWVLGKILVANFLCYLYTPSTGSDINDAENQIVVKNDARDVHIPCSINTEGQPQSDLGLYLCPTMAQCRSDRDRFIIARIEKRTVFNYDPEEYKLTLNGTLIVRKISSKYDGMVVWCIGQIRYQGVRENTTLIQIARGTSLFRGWDLIISIKFLSWKITLRLLNPFLPFFIRNCT